MENRDPICFIFLPDIGFRDYLPDIRFDSRISAEDLPAGNSANPYSRKVMSSRYCRIMMFSIAASSTLQKLESFFYYCFYGIDHQMIRFDIQYITCNMTISFILNNIQENLYIILDFQEQFLGVYLSSAVLTSIASYAYKVRIKKIRP